MTNNSRITDQSLAALKIGDVMVDLGLEPTADSISKVFNYIISEYKLDLKVPPKEFLVKLNTDFYSQEIAPVVVSPAKAEAAAPVAEEVKKPVELDLSDLF